jgi:tetrapyrrole methylase family protein/MazG family protein
MCLGRAQVKQGPGRVYCPEWSIVSDSTRFEELVAIMDRLRSPGGCPWDREQTYESLRSYLIEECYEVAEALDQRDPDALREELGDLLLQIVFLARLAKEEQRFTVEDVVGGIVEKMIRRHPHVFGGETAETSSDVLEHWERIKRQEKANGNGDPDEIPSVLTGIPKTLPALLKAQRLGTKAARVGFDWNRPDEVFEKIHEELDELRAAMARERLESARAEIGDLLFSVVNLARHLAIDPEAALEETNLKFTRRFQWIERELAASKAGFDGLELEQLEELWSRAKQALAEGESEG